MIDGVDTSGIDDSEGADLGVGAHARRAEMVELVHELHLCERIPNKELARPAL